MRKMASVVIALLDIDGEHRLLRKIKLVKRMSAANTHRAPWRCHLRRLGTPTQSAINESERSD
jgi:hypothetical protein